MITRSNVPTKAVYDLQIIYKALGMSIGIWPDMVNGSPTGQDGKFGPTMEQLTKDLQAKYSLPITGSVDAATYGKIALALLEKNTGITQTQVDAIVAAAVEVAKKPLNEKITALAYDLTNLAVSKRLHDDILSRY